MYKKSIPGGKACGSCVYWDHSNKRNVSHLESPVYYSNCLFSLDNIELPSCLAFEETNEFDGNLCPCFALK